MDLQKLLDKIDVKEVGRRIGEYRRASSGEDVDTAPERAIYLPLEPEASTFFTKERLRLMQCLRDHGPRSVGELAEQLERNEDAVSRDVRFLANMRILDVERDEGDARRKIVRLSDGEIRMILGSR